MDEILAFLGWFLVELILINTGRAVVSVTTFGKWRGERTSEQEGRIYGLAGALSFVREGKRVVTANGLLFAGITFYVLLALAAVAYA